MDWQEMLSFSEGIQTPKLLGGSLASTCPVDIPAKLDSNLHSHSPSSHVSCRFPADIGVEPGSKSHSPSPKPYLLCQQRAQAGFRGLSSSGP